MVTFGQSCKGSTIVNYDASVTLKGEIATYSMALAL